MDRLQFHRYYYVYYYSVNHYSVLCDTYYGVYIEVFLNFWQRDYVRAC